MSSDLNATSIITDKLSNTVGVTYDGTNFRLCVDTRPGSGVTASQDPLGTVPANKILWMPLLNGTAAEMAVNGSVTNRVYTATPPANSTVFAVRLFVSSTGTLFNGNSFGGVGSGGLLGTINPAGLANGLLLQVNAASALTPLANIVTNEDLFTMNANAVVEYAGAGSLTISTMLMNQPFAGAATDAITFTVRDNLTGRNAYSIKAFALGIKA